MNTKFLTISPVLPSSDISRDVAWYGKNTGFKALSFDEMYAVLHRENLFIHLQWHADTKDDPLLGGAVIRVFVQNIKPLFDEFEKVGLIQKHKLQTNTAWNTNEFGFFDLNNNAIFFVEDV